MLIAAAPTNAGHAITPETRVRLVENGWEGTWDEFVADNLAYVDPADFEDIRLSLVATGEAIIGSGAAYQFTLVLPPR
jgi:hypothetical protein